MLQCGLPMSKELVVAVLIGIGLGAIVTYGIYSANKAIRNQPASTQANVTNSPLNTADKNTDLQLRVDSPQNFEVSPESDIEFTGLSSPAAVIIILAEDQEYITMADEEGIFKQTVTLVRGANTIQISASDGTKTTSPQTFDLVYSTEIKASTQ